MSLERIKTNDALRSYLQGYKDNGTALFCSFLHHTLEPDGQSFNGMTTMRGIQYTHIHRTNPPGKDIYCHLYSWPDGTWCTGRPPSANNCACQAPPKTFAQSKLPSELRRLMAEHNPGGFSWRSWPNAYGFSVETVGNFNWPDGEKSFSENPETSTAMAASLDALALVHEIWGIPVEHCFFHRNVSFKTCPGNRVSREWVHKELRRRLNMPDDNRPDVSAWAAPSVERVKALGLMNGYPDRTFGGTKPITREEVAVIICRALDLYGG